MIRLPTTCNMKNITVKYNSVCTNYILPFVETLQTYKTYKRIDPAESQWVSCSLGRGRHWYFSRGKPARACVAGSTDLYVAYLAAKFICLRSRTADATLVGWDKKLIDMALSNTFQ